MIDIIVYVLLECFLSATVTMIGKQDKIMVGVSDSAYSDCSESLLV